MKADEMMFSLPNRLKLKTYSHLAGQKRIPSEYELVTSKMLYYPQKGGFEVTTPLSAWYEQYQKKSRIHVGLSAWQRFADPQETTYTSYIKRQRDKEIVLESNFRHIDETGYDLKLSEEWVETLSKLLGPLRFPWHGLQMISSYIGSMAPEGKIVIVFAFQTMDEIRRIQSIAYRMRQLQMNYPNFGIDSRTEWQREPQWQPLRRCIELLLVTYDWLESAIVLNMCFKPILDQLILIHFSHIAKKQGDTQLETLFFSFWEDACWQQLWSMHLLELVLEGHKNNKHLVEELLGEWLKEIVPAILALQPFFSTGFGGICNTVFSRYTEMLHKVDLQVNLSW